MDGRLGSERRGGGGGKGRDGEPGSFRFSRRQGWVVLLYMLGVGFEAMRVLCGLLHQWVRMLTLV